MQCANQGRRYGYLEDGFFGIDPIGLGVVVTVSRTAFRTEVPIRNDAAVDRVAQTPQYVAGARAGSEASRSVNHRLHVERLGDLFGQDPSLLVLKLNRQIRKETVSYRDWLDEGRIDPGMELGSDFALPIA